MQYRKKGSFNTDNYPSIHFTGSVLGMKKLGYWKRNDEIVRCGQYYYNLSSPIKPFADEKST
jgi:hypothetical protein